MKKKNTYNPRGNNVSIRQGFFDNDGGEGWRRRRGGRNEKGRPRRFLALCPVERFVLGLLFRRRAYLAAAERGPQLSGFRVAFRQFSPVEIAVRLGALRNHLDAVDRPGAEGHREHATAKHRRDLRLRRLGLHGAAFRWFLWNKGSPANRLNSGL